MKLYIHELGSSKFYRLFWFFVVGCLFGTIYEVILCLFQTGHFAYRQGLIYGPFYPVYGFGAVLFYLTIYRMKQPILIFLTGTLLGGIYEFLFSFVQDLIFHMVSWDYSNVLFHFQGRTSIFHAMGWGLLGLLFVYVLAPFFDWVFDCFPKKLKFVTTWILLFFFLFDFMVTSFALFRYTERKQNIPSTHPIDDVLDHYYTDHFLQKRFPTMRESQMSKR